MRKWRFGMAGLLVVLWVGGSDAALPFFRRNPAAPMPPSFPVSPDDLAGRREEVMRILEHPTLTASGPSETFECNPKQYQFFLEHPNHGVTVWRRMGAKCVSISDRGNGQFGWADDLGSEVTWETVHKSKDLRIWYAHGKVRPGPVLPMVNVELVVVLHHHETAATDGHRTIEHHADVYLHTDSKTAQLFARLMGTSTSRLAEQGLGQMQLFFSALCWYLDRHPERAQGLLRGLE